MKYTKEQLAPIVAESKTRSEVLRKLGLQQAGGNSSHLKKVLEKLGIDTSHFTGKKSNTGRRFDLTDPLSVLVLRTIEEPITNGSTLRKMLLKIGRVYACAECGQGPRWNGKPLVLPVDHINGQRWDNRPENLRFLCGHCHSQTNTFSGRNRRLRIPMAEDSGLEPVQ